MDIEIVDGFKYKAKTITPEDHIRFVHLIIEITRKLEPGESFVIVFGEEKLPVAIRLDPDTRKFETLEPALVEEEDTDGTKPRRKLPGTNKAH
jgi:hypothetical protein